MIWLTEQTYVSVEERQDSEISQKMQPEFEEDLRIMKKWFSTRSLFRKGDGILSARLVSDRQPGVHQEIDTIKTNIVYLCLYMKTVRILNWEHQFVSEARLIQLINKWKGANKDVYAFTQTLFWLDFENWPDQRQE